VIRLYLLTLAVFLTLDSLWLGIVSKDFYRKQIGWLMNKDFDFRVAAIFYLLFTVGILFLVLVPAIEKNSINQAVLMGGLLGLCSYGAYDLTNMAVIKNWPLVVTIVDMLWGTVLGASVAGVSFFLKRKIGF